MRGPDFVIARVAGWSEPPGQRAELALADGSRWWLDAQRGDYAAQVTLITLAMRRGSELLVSGDRAAGRIERIAGARRLAAQSVGPADVDGRRPVLFHGPPSVYYLRMDRAGAAQALALLHHSSSSGAFLDTPDLLVGIDTVNSEIILVQALARP